MKPSHTGLLPKMGSKPGETCRPPWGSERLHTHGRHTDTYIHVKHPLLPRQAPVMVEQRDDPRHSLAPGHPKLFTAHMWAAGLLWARQGSPGYGSELCLVYTLEEKDRRSTGKVTKA